MKINKFLAVLLALVMIFLTGCFNSSEEYYTPGEIARQQGQDIIHHIQNRDSESLKAMLCENLKSRANIDSEIEELFNFIDGEIISYDEPNGSIQSKSTTPQGTDKLGIHGDVCNIKTSTGKTYVVKFYSYLVYLEEEENVGVASITLFNHDTYDPEYGYPDEGKYYITIDE